MYDNFFSHQWAYSVICHAAIQFRYYGCVGFGMGSCTVDTAFEKYSGSLLFTGLSTTSIKALWPGHTAKLNTTYDGS